MESSTWRILWDPYIKEALNVFFWNFFQLIRAKQETWRWSGGLGHFHYSSSVWKPPGWLCHQRTTWVKPEDKSVLCWCGLRKWRKTKQRIQIYRIQKKSGMPHRWHPTKSYFHSVKTWQHQCLLLQVSSAKPRENDWRVPCLSKEMMLLLLFCSPKSSLENLSLSSMENPCLRTSRYIDLLSRCCSLYRTFIVEDGSEEKHGQWAVDELIGEQGYVDDEILCFWTWDDSQSTWKTRPFKSRQSHFFAVGVEDCRKVFNDAESECFCKRQDGSA